MRAVEPSGEQSGGNDEEVKLLDMFLARSAEENKRN